MPEIVIPYEPRALQAHLHEQIDSHRFSLFVCHRRFGKTVAMVNQLVKAAISCQLSRPRYAYMAPLYRQAKQIAWDYLRFYTAPFPGRKVYESDLRVDLPNGARIQLFGADNPDALRGIYLDGVVLDEYAQMQARLWPEVILPTLADREGWAAIIGTPQGQNDFYRKYQHALTDEEWACELYKSSETQIIPENELRRLGRMMSEEQYAQEFECDFAVGTPGAYYARLLGRANEDQRIKPQIAAEPQLRTYTAWDLGIGDSTAIWWAQLHHNEVRIIDYYEASGEALSHYIDVVKRRGEQRGLTYEAHLAPHDIEVRELTSGRARIDVARELGIAFQVVPRHSLEDGIEAGRNLIPRCWFDSERCERGLEALRSYRRDVIARTGELSTRPLHDWSSHAADAFRYLALGIGDAQSGWSDISDFEQAAEGFVV